MDRKEIISRLSVAADATKKDSGIFMDAFLQVISEALANGETVNLRGFGTFETKGRKPCKTYHPNTHEEVFIPGHNVCKFTQSQKLRRMLNDLEGD